MIEELKINENQVTRIIYDEETLKKSKTEMLGFVSDLIENGEPICGFEITGEKRLIGSVISFDKEYFSVSKMFATKEEEYDTYVILKAKHEEAVATVYNIINDLKTFNVPHRVLFEEALYS